MKKEGFEKYKEFERTVIARVNFIEFMDNYKIPCNKDSQLKDLILRFVQYVACDESIISYDCKYTDTLAMFNVRLYNMNGTMRKSCEVAEDIVRNVERNDYSPYINLVQPHRIKRINSIVKYTHIATDAFLHAVEGLIVEERRQRETYRLHVDVVGVDGAMIEDLEVEALSSVYFNDMTDRYYIHSKNGKTFNSSKESVIVALLYKGDKLLESRVHEECFYEIRDYAEDMMIEYHGETCATCPLRMQCKNTEKRERND